MELALEGSVPWFQSQRKQGFNPCYYGIGFRSQQPVDTLYYRLVSILVIMELALEGTSDG